MNTIRVLHRRNGRMWNKRRERFWAEICLVSQIYTTGIHSGISPFFKLNRMWKSPIRDGTTAGGFGIEIHNGERRWWYSRTYYFARGHRPRRILEVRISSAVFKTLFVTKHIVLFARWTYFPTSNPEKTQRSQQMVQVCHNDYDETMSFAIEPVPVRETAGITGPTRLVNATPWDLPFKKNSSVFFGKFIRTRMRAPWPNSCP